MLRGKATLPLWFETSHEYVYPAVTEPINEPVGLIRAGFSAVGLFLGRKSKISREQNVKVISILHKHAKFQASRFNNKKKYPKVADPLNSEVHKCICIKLCKQNFVRIFDYMAPWNALWF